MKVFVLTHLNKDPELRFGEDKKFIGIYSEEDLANRAIEKTKKLPGFKDAKDGFIIEEFTLDEIKHHEL